MTKILVTIKQVCVISVVAFFSLVINIASLPVHVVMWLAAKLKKFYNDVSSYSDNREHFGAYNAKRYRKAHEEKHKDIIK